MKIERNIWVLREWKKNKCCSSRVVNTRVSCGIWKLFSQAQAFHVNLYTHIAHIHEVNVINSRKIEEWPVEMPSQAKNRLSLWVQFELFIIRLILSEGVANAATTTTTTASSNKNSTGQKWTIQTNFQHKHTHIERERGGRKELEQTNIFSHVVRCNSCVLHAHNVCFVLCEFVCCNEPTQQ